ncbi:hypothetical protein [Helicobacter ibis]|uniref:PglD N-terminal domain-containing protein n=1 Tax=Helicobacter ibis TaxID=2962633 RepID=A0ABT4VFG5_9HELI|nr:hypothetical protein [Helicobacter ibis]MDA3969441.1 hypothetical protein [Helicobacter ibis]
MKLVVCGIGSAYKYAMELIDDSCEIIAFINSYELTRGGGGNLIINP